MTCLEFHPWAVLAGSGFFGVMFCLIKFDKDALPSWGTKDKKGLFIRQSVKALLGHSGEGGMIRLRGA